MSIPEILEKYPDRVPVIVSSSKDIRMERTKFLVPGEKSVGEFMCMVRKYTNALDSSSALFLLVDSMLPAQTMTMFDLYRNHKGEGGCLHIHVRRESTFGFNSCCSQWPCP